MASTTQTAPPTNPGRLIKRQAVEKITALSRSEIYRRIAAGTFPKQIPLGPKSVAWVETEVLAWCGARIAESRVGVA
jgi:prophage regulatory protein